MISNFSIALAALLQPDREGGFSNNPADPGGMTNLGVTKRVWEAWVGHTVSESDIRELTAALVAPLYKLRYWNAASCDSLPAGVDYAVFDCAVNSGPVRAIKFLQKAVSATEDGIMGPHTLAAVMAKPRVDVIAAYNAARLAFLQDLPTWNTFKGGWSRRVVEITAEATAMTA
jgi:lysozyme family protein